MSYIGNTNTTQAFTPAVDYFNGTGSQTVFTLSRPVASVAQIQVTVNNVEQNPSSAYTVNGNTLTFTGAPSSGTNNVYVYYTSPITQVIQPGQGTVMPTSLATDGTFQFPNISYTGTLTGNGGIVNIGSGQIYKDASGNVGFGTSSPTQRLHAVAAASNNTVAKFESGTGSTTMYLQLSSNGQSAADSGYIGYDSSKNMTFYNANAEKMRIDSSGNVGIGTSSAGNRLVTASSATNSKIEIQNKSTAASTSKTSALQFSGTDTVGTLKETGNIYVTPADNDYVGSNMLFYTRGGDTIAERARIDSSGNLLVGDTAASGKFVATSTSTSQIVSRVYAKSSAYTTEAMQIITDTASGTAYNLLAIYNSGGAAYALRVRGDGQLYTPFLGTGTLYSNAGVLTNTNPSDERLKSDITDLAWGLQDILKLRPVSYVWKNNQASQGIQYGFVAQEVQKVMPELIREFEYEEDKITKIAVMRLGLEKEGIYAAMVKAIQEQQALITTLTERITALEGAK